MRAVMVQVIQADRRMRCRALILVRLRACATLEWMKFFMRYGPMLLCLFACGCDQAVEVVVDVMKRAAAESRSSAAEDAGAIGCPGEVSRLTSANYDAFESRAGCLVVVGFHAEWCGPCQRMVPLLDQMAREFADRVMIGTVDVDQQRSIALKRGVQGIPDLRFFLDGKEVDRIVGLPSATELKQVFTKHSARAKTVPVSEPSAASGPKEPEIRPLSEGWLPPGMQRKNGGNGSPRIKP